MIGKVLSIVILYIGTCFYTTASFYHLRLNHWNFWSGYAMAIPLVCIEYIFNIWGTKRANMNGLNVVQIMIMIIAFYMLNIWLMNVFVLRQTVVAWREAMAMILLCGSVAVSSNMVSLSTTVVP